MLMSDMAIAYRTQQVLCPNQYQVVEMAAFSIQKLEMQNSVFTPAPATNLLMNMLLVMNGSKRQEISL